MSDGPATVPVPDCENPPMTIEQNVPAERAADLVRQLYRSFLGREPSEEDVITHVGHLQLDGTMTAVSGIVYSQEAIAARTRRDEPPPPASPSPLPDGMLSIGRTDVAEVIARALAAVRRDPPSAYEVELRVNDFGRGTQLATILDDTFRSPPLAEPAEDSVSIDRTIEIMYRLALGRTPGPIDFEVWRATASNGPLSNVVLGIGESPEAKSLRVPLEIEPGTEIQLAFEVVLGRGATAAEVDTFRAMISESGWDISTLVWRLFADEAKCRLLPSLPANNPQQAYIFGSCGLVTVADWRLAAKTAAPIAANNDVLSPGSVIRLAPPGASPDECVVSIITSLYRGGAFIRSFLDNITSQTIFRTHCELIIIDANSPEGEEAVIDEYRRDFPNIVYRRMETRIGIYEAWNIAVGIARGRYVTNANLDDSRRVDSLEIQAATLDTFDFVDVAYQDVLYSFEPRLPFDEIAQRDFRTNLPIVSRYNLMEFNHPHNAPMWRAALHRDVGPFNQSLQSAADFEFWLRCRAAGKTFYKINEAHAAYFVNPDGISTRPDTRGVVEANAVSRDLYRKLVAPTLVISDDEFLANVDIISQAPLRTGRRYDIVQSALIAIGAHREEVTA